MNTNANPTAAAAETAYVAFVADDNGEAATMAFIRATAIAAERAAIEAYQKTCWDKGAFETEAEMEEAIDDDMSQGYLQVISIPLA